MTTGSLFIVSAPSGAGKTSLVKALVSSTAGVQVCVSHTTRPPRSGEKEGVHYHFASRERFGEMVDGGDFLEYAQVFGNAYGTARSSVADIVERGDDAILEIDWQGARQVRSHAPDCSSIFILPPSRDALESRLNSRGQDSETVVRRRMQDAESEMRHYDEFDYVVINDDFDTALEELRCLVRARRLALSAQQARARALIASLLRPDDPD
ncbi:MAG: guanylate kinase [Pseudomonadota bacterium]|nr:guanylate kinase [Pseudomonadota bacterium]